jgi:hypothetical protein
MVLVRFWVSPRRDCAFGMRLKMRRIHGCAHLGASAVKFEKNYFIYAFSRFFHA